MHSYVTVAALLRPVTEALRLRTAKDMAALEQLLSSLYTLPKPNDCPVLREFRWVGHFYCLLQGLLMLITCI